MWHIQVLKRWNQRSRQRQNRERAKPLRFSPNHPHRQTRNLPQPHTRKRRFPLQSERKPEHAHIRRHSLNLHATEPKRRRRTAQRTRQIGTRRAREPEQQRAGEPRHVSERLLEREASGIVRHRLQEMRARRTAEHEWLQIGE